MNNKHLQEKIKAKGEKSFAFIWDYLGSCNLFKSSTKLG